MARKRSRTPAQRQAQQRAAARRQEQQRVERERAEQQRAERDQHAQRVLEQRRRDPAPGPVPRPAPHAAPVATAARETPTVPGPRAAETGPAETPDGQAAPSRLRGLLRPRLRRIDAAVGVLLALLGFGVAVQVRQTRGEGTLSTARQQDLVTLLDDLTNRNDRLRQEVASLQGTAAALGAGDSAAARAAARSRAQVLGVLAGTVAASGPGIVLTIQDPHGSVRAGLLLDTLEELRDAGAEAVQVEGGSGGATAAVRVVASTSFLDGTMGVRVDGTPLDGPYRFRVVGDPATLSAALAIPGGVLDTVRAQGATATVARGGDVRVGALRPLDRPRYARPDPSASASPH